MPLFDFQCLQCSATFEALAQRGAASPACTACGSERTNKLISGFSIGGRGSRQHNDPKTPVKNDGGPHDSIGNRAAALRAKGKASCC